MYVKRVNYPSSCDGIFVDVTMEVAGCCVSYGINLSSSKVVLPCLYVFGCVLNNAHDCS